MELNEQEQQQVLERTADEQMLGDLLDGDYNQTPEEPGDARPVRTQVDEDAERLIAMQRAANAIQAQQYDDRSYSRAQASGFTGSKEEYVKQVRGQASEANRAIEAEVDELVTSDLYQGQAVLDVLRSRNTANGLAANAKAEVKAAARAADKIEKAIADQAAMRALAEAMERNQRRAAGERATQPSAVADQPAEVGAPAEVIGASTPEAQPAPQFEKKSAAAVLADELQSAQRAVQTLSTTVYRGLDDEYRRASQRRANPFVGSKEEFRAEAQTRLNAAKTVRDDIIDQIAQADPATQQQVLNELVARSQDTGKFATADQRAAQRSASKAAEEVQKRLNDEMAMASAATAITERDGGQEAAVSTMAPETPSSSIEPDVPPMTPNEVDGADVKRQSDAYWAHMAEAGRLWLTEISPDIKAGKVKGAEQHPSYAKFLHHQTLRTEAAHWFVGNGVLPERLDSTSKMQKFYAHAVWNPNVQDRQRAEIEALSRQVVHDEPSLRRALKMRDAELVTIRSSDGPEQEFGTMGEFEDIGAVIMQEAEARLNATFDRAKDVDFLPPANDYTGQFGRVATKDESKHQSAPTPAGFEGMFQDLGFLAKDLLAEGAAGLGLDVFSASKKEDRRIEQMIRMELARQRIIQNARDTYASGMEALRIMIDHHAKENGGKVSLDMMRRIEQIEAEMRDHAIGRRPDGDLSKHLRVSGTPYKSSNAERKRQAELSEATYSYAIDLLRDSRTILDNARIELEGMMEREIANRRESELQAAQRVLAGVDDRATQQALENQEKALGAAMEAEGRQRAEAAAVAERERQRVLSAATANAIDGYRALRGVEGEQAKMAGIEIPEAEKLVAAMRAADAQKKADAVAYVLIHDKTMRDQAKAAGLDMKELEAGARRHARRTEQERTWSSDQRLVRGYLAADAMLEAERAAAASRKERGLEDDAAPSSAERIVNLEQQAAEYGKAVAGSEFLMLMAGDFAQDGSAPGAVARLPAHASREVQQRAKHLDAVGSAQQAMVDTLGGALMDEVRRRQVAADLEPRESTKISGNAELESSRLFSRWHREAERQEAFKASGPAADYRQAKTEEAYLRSDAAISAMMNTVGGRAYITAHNAIDKIFVERANIGASRHAERLAAEKELPPEQAIVNGYVALERARLLREALLADDQALIASGAGATLVEARKVVTSELASIDRQQGLYAMAITTHPDQEIGHRMRSAAAERIITDLGGKALASEAEANISHRADQFAAGAGNRAADAEIDLALGKPRTPELARDLNGGMREDLNALWRTGRPKHLGEGDLVLSAAIADDAFPDHYRRALANGHGDQQQTAEVRPAEERPVASMEPSEHIAGPVPNAPPNDLNEHDQRMQKACKFLAGQVGRMALRLESEATIKEAGTARGDNNGGAFGEIGRGILDGSSEAWRRLRSWNWSSETPEWPSERDFTKMVRRLAVESALDAKRTGGDALTPDEDLAANKTKPSAKLVKAAEVKLYEMTGEQVRRNVDDTFAKLIANEPLSSTEEEMLRGLSRSKVAMKMLVGAGTGEVKYDRLAFIEGYAGQNLGNDLFRRQAGRAEAWLASDTGRASVAAYQTGRLHQLAEQMDRAVAEGTRWTPTRKEAKEIAACMMGRDVNLDGDVRRLMDYCNGAARHSPQEHAPANIDERAANTLRALGDIATRSDQARAAKEKFTLNPDEVDVVRSTMKDRDALAWIGANKERDPFAKRCSDYLNIWSTSDLSRSGGQDKGLGM